MSSGKIINNFQLEPSDRFNLNVDFSYKVESGIAFPFFFSRQLNKNNLEVVLNRIFKIHSFLKTNINLSNSQRLDYCKIERVLMIQYLKEIVKKL